MERISDAKPLNPETHTCPDCGYVWKHGQHGGHSCSKRLKARIRKLEWKIEAARKVCQGENYASSAEVLSALDSEPPETSPNQPRK